MGESLFFPPTSGNKGSSGSHKNLASHVPGADLLKLDGSKATVLCINMYQGKGLWTRSGGSCLHLPCMWKLCFGAEKEAVKIAQVMCVVGVGAEGDETFLSQSFPYQ